MNYISQMTSSPTSSIQARPTMLVDEKHRVIFCYIAKVGCTSWKWLLIALQGRYNISQPERLGQKVHTVRVQVGHGLKPLEKYTSDEIEYRLQHYHKIMAVRNPIGRIVSAYNDKFVPYKDPTNEEKIKCLFCRQFGPAILKKTRYSTNETSPSLLLEEHVVDESTTASLSETEELENEFDSNTFTINFEEFIKYVTSVNPKLDDVNRHWNSYYDLCNPCGVDYDYIVKMETVASDTHVLLPLIFNTTAEFPRTNEAKKIGIDNKATADDIPETLRDIIDKRFGLDMKLFDYKYPWENDNS